MRTSTDTDDVDGFEPSVSRPVRCLHDRCNHRFDLFGGNLGEARSPYPFLAMQMTDWPDSAYTDLSVGDRSVLLDLLDHALVVAHVSRRVQKELVRAACTLHEVGINHTDA